MVPESKERLVSSAIDVLEKLEVEFEHVNNLLEVLQAGFQNYHYSDEECPSSCIYIVESYMQHIQEIYVVKLISIMEELKKN